MSTHAPQHMDPLARLGRQIVVAAERRAARRHRQRTLALLCMATLALVAIAGVGALESNIVGPIPPPYVTDFADGFTPTGDQKVTLAVHDGLEKEWKVAMFRAEESFCITAPTSVMRTAEVGCGAAIVAGMELASIPASGNGTIVQSGPNGDDVLVTGFARPDVTALTLRTSEGGTVERRIEGETITAPARWSEDATPPSPRYEPPDGKVTARPFAVVFTVPDVGKRLRLFAHTGDGAETPFEVRVIRSPQATP